MRDDVAVPLPSDVSPGIGGVEAREAAVVEGCRRGDPDSLAALMRRHGGRVMGLLRGIVGDPATAEALAQEAFFKAFRNMDRFQIGTNLRVWLFTIARNTALDHLRREKAARVAAVDLNDIPEPVEPREGPAGSLARAEARDHIREAVQTLPVEEREIVVLRVFEEMTWDAIGEALELPEATARARMDRALERLRFALRGFGPGESQRQPA